MSGPTTGNLTERFTWYFDREVAQTAAKSISNGAEIEFHVGDEIFTFTKAGGKNSVVSGPARDPQLQFTLGAKAAQDILEFPSEEVGEIGVHIAKMIAGNIKSGKSADAEKKVSIQFKSGFLGLFTKGYFGVLATGGSHFGSFLASQGLNGIGAIKSFLGKIK